MNIKEIIDSSTIIGIDIDGTLADTIRAVIESICKRYWNIISYDEWDYWNPHEIEKLRRVWITEIKDTVFNFLLYYSKR